ncbi:hypothetical protein ACFRQM_25170 [Streptomyces sp. NPDC056831]
MPSTVATAAADRVLRVVLLLVSVPAVLAMVTSEGAARRRRVREH